MFQIELLCPDCGERNQKFSLGIDGQGNVALFGHCFSCGVKLQDVTTWRTLQGIAHEAEGSERHAVLTRKSQLAH